MNWKEFITCFGFGGKAWKCIDQIKLSRSISKNDEDIQTVGDLSANEIILETALKYINQKCISSEESPNQITTGLIVDPIDGTSNFYRNIPTYTHAVSYIENGILKYFSIYIPNENILLYGNSHKMYFNEELLESKYQISEKKMLIVSVMYNTHYTEKQKELLLKILQVLMKNDINVRITGTPSYDIANAILNKIDAFINIKPHQFDAVPLSQILLNMKSKTCLTIISEGFLEKVLVGGNLEAVHFIRDYLSEYI